MKDFEIRHIPDDEPDEPAVLGAGLGDVLSQPDPYNVKPAFDVQPPVIDIPVFEGGTGEGGAEYEVFDEAGNAELVDTSAPGGNVHVPNEQLKAKMEAQARAYLHRLKKHNNRQAELQKRKNAKLKKSRKKKKLEKASRKANR